MNSRRLASAPSTESLQAIEASAKRLSPETAILSQWHDSYVLNRKLRIALDLDIVKDQVVVGRSVSELGSVPLLLTVALSRCDYKVTGCDIAPERYASAIERTGITVVKCDIETERLPFPDNWFDAVVCNELFEHLRINPIFTMLQVLRVMKPGATMMMSTPNLRSLGGLTNFIFKNKAFSCAGDMYEEYNKLQKLGHMRHVREYTTSEVIEFLQKIGFVVSGLLYRGQYGGKLKGLLIRAIPQLSPFVSYVANKPIEQGG